MSRKTYRVIDFDHKGNVVRFFLAATKENIKESWGDDWDDRPYEHNAGEVYDQYVEKIIDVFYPYDMRVTEPQDDWHYNYNSPYSKEDFKNRKAPCLVLYMPEENDWFSDLEYSKLIGNDKATKIYYGDDLGKILKIASYWEEKE